MNAHPNLRWHIRLAAPLAACLLLGACGTTVVNKAEDLVQVAMVKARTKGDRRLAEPTEVARELSCGTAGAAAARFEATEVLPERRKAGNEISHRLVYAACPVAAEGLSGTLTRRFMHQGRVVFQDSEPYALKPGRWSVNVFIGIPPQATPGPYRLEVRFERRGLQLERTSDFTVLAPELRGGATVFHLFGFRANMLTMQINQSRTQMVNRKMQDPQVRAQYAQYVATMRVRGLPAMNFPRYAEKCMFTRGFTSAGIQARDQASLRG